MKLKDNPIGEVTDLRYAEPPEGYDSALAYYAHVLAERHQVAANGVPADGIVSRQLSDNRVLFTWFDDALPVGFELADVRVPGAF